MTEQERIEHFTDDVERFIDSRGLEYNISTASAIGSLWIIIHKLTEDNED